MLKKRDEDTIFPPISALKIGSDVLDLDRTRIMAILNVTDDSFYSNSRVLEDKDILQSADKALSDGADILDLGAQSTRPGAPTIDKALEIKQITRATKLIIQHFPEARISIDTTRSEVAQAGLDEGAGMINDVSGGDMDSEMWKTIAKNKCAYVCMHMRGTPVTMQDMTRYDDVVEEVFLYFQRKVHQMKSMGIEQILLDPGVGFAKTVEQNFDLLHRGERFHALGLPILYGISRKSFIQKTIGVDAAAALNGTTALHALLTQRERSILRVHDVLEAKQTIQLIEAFTRPCQ